MSNYRNMIYSLKHRFLSNLGLFILIFSNSLFINDLTGQKLHPSFQSIQQGLSNNSIHSILKDSKGFVWFGTSDGLNKYDGTNFVIYENDPADSTSLCHNTVNAIVEDRYGNLWVGTSEGLCIYNREKDDFHILKDFKGKNNVFINELYADNKGYIWIGTFGNGIFLYDLEKSKLYNFKHDPLNKNTVSSNVINRILPDKNDNVWIGTRDGLDLFNSRKKTFEHFFYDSHDSNSLSKNFVSALALNKEGNLWVGTQGEGLNKLVYENGKAVFLHYKSSNHPGSISNNYILSLCEDKKGNLWIGTENGGLNCLYKNAGKFITYYSEEGNPSSPSSNSIWSIYEDRTGIIWMGTYHKGLNFMDEKSEKFELFKRNSFSKNTLGNNLVTGFAEDNEGNLWITTDGGGISCFNTKSRRFIYSNNTSLSKNATTSVMVDAQQSIWIGTWAGGIDIFNKKGTKINHYQLKGRNGYADNILCIFEDRQRNVWVGTAANGLFYRKAGTKTFIQVIDESEATHLTATAYATTIIQDSQDNILVGTLFGLVFIKKTDHGFSFSDFIYSDDNPKSLSSSRISFIFEDSKNRLWVGTEDKGLNLLDKRDNSFIKFKKENGLPNNSIKAILEDKKGGLWISTNKGITRFDPATRTFVSYTREDGLNSDIFQFRSCIETKAGEFVFGGDGGFNIFNPDSIKVNTDIPSIYLTDFKTFNKSVPIGDKNSPLKRHISQTEKIVLTHLQTSFTIEYVAINYTRGSKNQYAYILEGLEKDWNYVGNKTSATYTYVRPGTYTFRVKGSNNDGIWNNDARELKIVILPPFWKTTWAKMVYFLVFFGILFAFVKLLLIKADQAHALKLERMEREKTEELNQLKHQFFTNISHELRTPLTLIIGPLKKLLSEQSSPDVLGTIYRNAMRLKTLVDQILDFSKIENQKMHLFFTRKDVVEAIHLYTANFAGLASQKDIVLIFKSSVLKCIAEIDEDKLDKILSNVVSNAIKNTPANGSVTVLLDFEAENSRIKIDISDTGRGITANEIEHIFDRFYTSENQVANNGSGIGLNFTQKLVELHQGKITVSSVPGKSTVFSIYLPLKVYETEFGQLEMYMTSPDLDHQRKNRNVLPEFKFGKTILVIDDNIEMCQFIGSILSDEFDVIQENNPFESINHIIKYLPDLIISDVMMPGLNGFDLCRQIKDDVRFSHIPLILLTAKVTTSDTVTGFEIGADDYIYKPFEGEILKARIKNLILQKEKLRQHFIGTDGIVNPKVTTNKLDVAFIDQIVTIIREHYVDPDFNVNDIIEKAGMSRSIFYKKFKALSDLSINDLIRNIRLKKAAELLQTGELTISQIAYNCGFNDPAYFSKVFKEYYKMSPREYTGKVQ